MAYAKIFNLSAANPALHADFAAKQNIFIVSPGDPVSTRR